MQSAASGCLIGNVWRAGWHARRNWLITILVAWTMFGPGGLWGIEPSAIKSPMETTLVTEQTRAGGKAVDTGSTFAYPWQPDQGDGTYCNPILYADYSDPDVIRAYLGAAASA